MPIEEFVRVAEEKRRLLELIAGTSREISALHDLLDKIREKFAPPPPEYGSLEGHVYDAETRASIGGARVDIAGLMDLTDGQGYYRIDDIPAGLHTATCRKSGYERESGDVMVFAGAVAVRDWHLAPVAARRVAISLYIIIESREKTYTYRDRRGRVKTVTRKYPSGRFQSTWECDAALDPATQEYTRIADDDLAAMKEDFVLELDMEFNASYKAGDVTVGAANVIPDQAEVGKAPKKLTLERTVDKPAPPGSSPKEDWQTKVDKFLPGAR